MEIKENRCKVCNNILIINRENIYQVRVNNFIFNDVIYDAVDCPHCGCQNLLKERCEKVRAKE